VEQNRDKAHSQTARECGADARVNFSLEIDASQAANALREIQQALSDLELTGKINVEIR